MSKSKLSLLIVGAIAVAGIALAGANVLVASSDDHGAAGSSCQSGVKAKTASSCPASACAKTAGASACPASSCAKTAGASAGCPSMAAASGASKGCPSMTSSEGGHKDCSMSSSASCSKPCGPKAEKTASIETINEREGARIVLTGHYACGYCDLGVSDGCQPAFQTKDGKNYLLAKNNLSKELKASARDTDVEIVTRVKKLDGAKYLEVEVVRHAS